MSGRIHSSRRLDAILIGALLAAPAIGAAQATPILGPAASKRIAEKVVTQSARVRPGELVWISGGERDVPLLEDIAVAVRKVGGYPIIEYGSNRLIRRTLAEVPATLDTITPQTRTLGISDVTISTEYVDPKSFAGFDPGRMATIQKANAPFREALAKWKGRAVSLGNGLYPTPGAAAEAGVSLDRLTGLYRAGLDVDYAAVERTADALRDILAHGKELHLTSPNGTDLRATIASQPVHTSDGVISDQDQEAGHGQVNAFLPAGEVYLVAKSGSAAGTLARAQAWYLGKPIAGLKVTVKDGKVTALTARQGGEALQAGYAAAGPGKEEVGIIDIGINPAVVAVPGSHLEPWSQAGLVTIAFGNNQWAGGDNLSGFSFAVPVAGATLTVDGKPLVQRGKLVVPRTEASR